MAKAAGPERGIANISKIHHTVDQHETSRAQGQTKMKLKAAMVKSVGPERGIAKIREMHNRRDQNTCLLYTSPSPRDRTRSRMPSSA